MGPGKLSHPHPKSPLLIKGQPGADAGLITGVDTGLWTLMSKNGDKPQKVADLAETLGFDHILLGAIRFFPPFVIFPLLGKNIANT